MGTNGNHQWIIVVAIVSNDANGAIVTIGLLLAPMASMTITAPLVATGTIGCKC
jgi:hypothetical protein